MPRTGRPRGGTDATPAPRRRAALHLVAPERGRERVPAFAPPPRRGRHSRFAMRPKALLTGAAAVADALAVRAEPAIPLGGPSAQERARRLRAAYDASVHDDGQRTLLREIMDHFRAWCRAHALGDPFVNA